MAAMTGTITTLVVAKGFGFIRGEDAREYFFHRSGLTGVSFDELTVGQAVEFEGEDAAKGPRAMTVRRA